MNAEYYEKDGKDYDRITRILDYFVSPELVDWKISVGKKEARRISTIATKIGTNVDEAIKADVMGKKIPKLASEEAKNCWEAYQAWKKDYGFDLFLPETVFDEELKVAGTPDLYTHNASGILIDVKCSGEIRPQYWLQTEFYARTIPLSFASKAILRLDKNLGIYEFKKMTLSDSHWEVVRSAIKLYRYYQNPSKDGKEEV